MVLYLVSTPIGNLQDITLRALEILGSVEVILAEDTRRTRQLLRAHGISGKKVIAFHDHNKERVTPQMISSLSQDIPIALVSDAGTPGVSDPGFYLVRACAQSQIPMVPVPGASAVLAGLVCSGLPTDRFFFHGFFPKKPGKRKTVVEEVRSISCTHIFYESPHRIGKMLAFLVKDVPSYQIVIGRELTKKFEEFIRGSVEEVYDATKEKKWKGELVVMLSENT